MPQTLGRSPIRSFADRPLGGMWRIVRGATTLKLPHLVQAALAATPRLTAERTLSDVHQPPAITYARIANGVIVRRERRWGAVAYVARRDRFFALDQHQATLVRQLSNGDWTRTEEGDRPTIRLLAELGICATDPPTPQRTHFGHSAVGHFRASPEPTAPLVINCFATSHCPLQCRYCHADDLMVPYREDEDERWLSDVIRTAAATPAIVGVVTGGEPLSRPDRTRRLIRELARSKSVVLDTSGVGDFLALLPTLREYNVHIRVSLDCADPNHNDSLRPINRRYLALSTSAHEQACKTIREAVYNGLSCSVQTVVTAVNSDLTQLVDLRELLISMGVTTWVLHVVVPAGKASRPDRSNLLPDATVLRTLDELVATTAADGCPLDIRVTSTHKAPNSVLLINARGELCVENSRGGGKITLRTAGPAPIARWLILRAFRKYIDMTGHSSRYLNGSLSSFPAPTEALLPGL